jgi:hypothetical protein
MYLIAVLRSESHSLLNINNIMKSGIKLDGLNLLVQTWIGCCEIPWFNFDVAIVAKYGRTTMGIVMEHNETMVGVISQCKYIHSMLILLQLYFWTFGPISRIYFKQEKTWKLVKLHFKKWNNRECKTLNTPPTNQVLSIKVTKHHAPPPKLPQPWWAPISCCLQSIVKHLP